MTDTARAGSKNILLHEVGLRDGLQMESQVVPLEKKAAWLSALLESGVDIIQVGSFVHPVKMPQMADTDELFRRFTADKKSKVVLSGLVLNEQGLERRLACGVELFCLGVSARETPSRKNTGMGTDEAVQRIIGAAGQAAAKKSRSASNPRSAAASKALSPRSGC